MSDLTVHCGDCGHEWTPVILPMEMAKAARVMRCARCPKCAATPTKIFCGPKPADFTPRPKRSDAR